MFAKHGLKNLLEKTGLDKFTHLDFKPREGVESLSVPERLKLSFEELGPTFVKFGQVLASRPDLIPEEYSIEFSKLHDSVRPLPFEVIKSVLEEEFGSHYTKTFTHIHQQPLGSASIAQVHRATLSTGEDVVIKVQRPHIIQVINDDLSVLYFIAEMLEKYLPELKPYNPIGLVDEYFKTLELETDFIVEANNIRRFQENFKNETEIKIPKVYLEHTTSRVLVLEMLTGTPLSSELALKQQNIERDLIMKLALKSYLKMVFIDGLFHGDLHAGNFFIFENNSIGLIDFGVVGRLNSKTQNSIINMLLALSKEDYDRLAYEYVDLAPFSDLINVDKFAKDLRSVIAPYYGLSLKHMNIGQILMKSANIAAQHHLSLPTELMMFFKSIVSIEGIGNKIQPDFDFLKHTLELINETPKYQLEPTKWNQEASLIFRESSSLIRALPRQLNLVLRRLSSPDHATKHIIPQLEELKKSFELSFNLLFLGIIIAALILSSSLLLTHPESLEKIGFPTLGLIFLAGAGVLSFVAFVNYIKK